MRVPWTARRSNQSILKEISPEYSLEGLMVKLKLQYFGHLMRRVDSLERTLMLGMIEGGRRRGQQRMRWLDAITDSMGYEFEETLGDSERQGRLACCSPRGHKESDTTWQSVKQILWALSDRPKAFKLHHCRGKISDRCSAGESLITGVTRSSGEGVVSLASLEEASK